MYSAVKNEIQRTFPDMNVHPNVVPIAFKDKFFGENTTSSFSLSKGNRIKFPRVGAFEVYYDGKVVASKLETGRWPNPLVVV